MNDKTTLEPWQTREAWDHLNELARQDHEQQRAEIERLRLALSRIAGCESYWQGDVVAVAREALK